VLLVLFFPYDTNTRARNRYAALEGLTLGTWLHAEW